MPFGDRTGPAGMGPRTGRGAGYCSGAGMPGAMNRPPGRGWFGMGRGGDMGRGGIRPGGGMGFGFRWSPPPPGPRMGWGRGGWPQWGDFPAGGPPPHVAPPPYAGPPADDATELDFLKGQASEMKEELKRIEKRMQDLEGKS